MNWRPLASLLALGLLIYIAGVASNTAIALMGGALLLIAVLGELTVHGVEGLAARLGLSGYSSSVLVNSVAVLPELFSAIALGYRGIEEGNPWLTELAILSVLVSAAFNLVVLGAIALLAGGVGVDRDVLDRELPLLRVAVASTALLAGYAVIEASLAGGGVQAPYSLLAAQLVFWLYYVTGVVREGVGASPRHAGVKLWPLMLLGGLLGMIWAAESMADAVKELIHELHIEHLGEAALAVGIASSSPEAVLALLAARRGRAREATGGLLAATSTSLLLVYPAAHMMLSSHLSLDSFLVYMLAMLAALLWVAKRSLAHENMIDSTEALYILALSAAALATLAIVK